MLRQEGLEQAWARHRRQHLALRAGLEAMGLPLAVPEEIRLPQLNAVTIPEGIEDAQVRGMLLGDYGLEIGGGLGDLAGKIWRIGLMGHACNARNVLLCLGALEDVLGKLGAPIAKGVARAAARQVLEG
jgi:alanine-glyoxylate transaminase/serine-glyoxylate transaminase/serine-pyruvate transaminase